MLKKLKFYISLSYIIIAVLLSLKVPIVFGITDQNLSGFTIPPYYAEHFHLMTIRTYLISYLILLLICGGIIIYFSKKKFLTRAMIIIPICFSLVMITLELPIYRCSTFGKCSSYWNLLGL